MEAVWIPAVLFQVMTLGCDNINVSIEFSMSFKQTFEMSNKRTCMLGLLRSKGANSQGHAKCNVVIG